MIACLSPNGSNASRGQAPADQLLVGTAQGVFRLARDGADKPWRVAGRTLEHLHVSSLLFEPKRGGLFAGIHFGGLYASMDGGQTWQQKTQGLTVEHVFTLASVERDGQVVLFAGTEPAHLFQSADYGESWDELPALRSVPGRDGWKFPPPPHLGHVKNIAFDPRDSRTIILCIEQGALLKSTDGGQSWQELTGYEEPGEDIFPKDCHRLLLRDSNPDQMYMTGGNGLYFTPDGGKTWEHLTNTAWRIGYPDGLVASPMTEQTLFMSGAGTDPSTWRQTHTANAAIVRTRDGGRTWERLQNGLPEQLHANIEALSINAWPGGFGLYAGTTDGEVFASEDQGESWTMIASDLGPVSKVGHYRNLL